MKTIHYMMIAAALLVTVSCNKSENTSGNEESIRFAAPVQTKAYSDPADHSYVFQVRDILNNGVTPHINNRLAYANGAWGYATGEQDQYKWNNGSHNLFGWLETDGYVNSATYFGSAPSLSGTPPTTLNIPAVNMTNVTKQYDFVYSQSVQRNTIANDYSDVPLVFKHLFAQVGISFKADPALDPSENPTIYEVYLNSHFKNKKSATISFASAGDPAVVYNDEASTGLFADKNSSMASSGIVYGASTTAFDVLSQTQSGSKSFYYVWPQTAADLQSVSDPVITVKYLFPGEGSAREIEMPFPAGTSWEAGKKYSYTISYMGGILKVNETVLPWDYESTDGLEASTQSAIAAWIGWDTGTCTVSGQTATFKNSSTPVRGIFRINSPTSCTYSIELEGANANKFTISSGGSGTIGTGAGQIKPGQNIEFYIATNGATSGDETNLVFSVTVGGRKYNIDSEIQRDGQFTVKL